MMPLSFKQNFKILILLSCTVMFSGCGIIWGGVTFLPPPIVTSGLAFYLDALRSSNNQTPYPTGCGATALTWYDLSSSKIAGTLTNFSGCNALEGWNGTGSRVNQFVLSLDGLG